MILVLFALLLWGGPSYAQEPAPSCGNPIQAALRSLVEPAASSSAAAISDTRLRALLGTVLETKDPAALDRAAMEFREAAAQARAARPEALRAWDRTADAEWPKDDVEYMFYVDQFGTPTKSGTFEDAKKMIPYLKDLGVDVLYPLPFLRSAGMDGGFDVMDFMNVEERLGGTDAFRDFLKEARRNGMKVKMDLILNHVSDQHEWFQKLLKGDLRYKDYFITRDTPPEIVRRYDAEGGKVVVYREKDASGHTIEVPRRLIFPDISDSHYREIKLPDGKKLWVYHTFYPFQLDLNYANPAVLKEAYKILGHWADEGVDLFRLDAIPFLDKTAENHPRTHSVVELMSAYLRTVAPGARFEVEACQKLEDIVRYFGHSTGTIPSESQMAYQFEGMANMWLSLVSGKKDYFTRYIHQEHALKVPKHAIWAQFLRVHDELTLEMVPDAAKEILRGLIREGKGASFREGNGVAGRLADFLGNDPDRIRSAFSLLMSQDGMPVIYYGDEIAARNDPAFMKAEEAARREYLARSGTEALGTRDARDVGRGPIARGRFVEAAHAGAGNPAAADVSARTFESLKEMIAARKASPALRRGSLELVPNNEEHVVSYLREVPGEKVLAVQNLSGAPVEVELDLGAGGAAAGDAVREQLQDLITRKQIRVRRDAHGKLRLRLPRYGAYWLKL